MSIQLSNEINRIKSDITPIGISLREMEGENLLAVNQAYADIIGKTIDEAMTDSHRDTKKSKKCLEFNQQWTESLIESGEHGPHQTNYLHKDGSDVIVRLWNRTLEIEDNQYMLSVMEDLTSDIYRHLLNESPVGMALCNMKGNLLDINPAFAGIIGRTVEDALSLSYWQITPKNFEKKEQEQLESLKKNKAYGPYSKTYIHKNQSHIPVILTGKIIELNGVECIWSVVEKMAVPQVGRFIHDLAEEDIITGLDIQLISREPLKT